MVASTILVNDSIKATINATIIKTIVVIFLIFIKNVEFSVYWDLVYILPNPQVYFTAIWANRDLRTPIVSIMSPLLLTVSHNIIVNSRYSEFWWWSDDHKPGWISECDLPITSNDKQCHIDYKENYRNDSFVHIHFGKCF
jgi:hypothetical protein